MLSLAIACCIICVLNVTTKWENTKLWPYFCNLHYDGEHYDHDDCFACFSNTMYGNLGKMEVKEVWVERFENFQILPPNFQT